MRFHTLDELAPRGKRVLLRADLNVPLKDGRVGDRARLEKLAPTIRELSRGGARVVVCSHLGRPEGKPVPGLSLKPVAQALAEVLGQKVGFVGSCVGPAAERAAASLGDGEVLVLENTRFDPREEKNDPAMAEELARLADFYVNDAFSTAHRAHASTEAVAWKLPSYAGRLMQAELDALASVLDRPERPLAAIVGGAKVSTKLELFHNLVRRVDVLVLGGAMANTFLAAGGIAVGRSLQEAELHGTAREILAGARKAGCEVLLPDDVVVGDRLAAGAAQRTVSVRAVPDEMMILDLGPATVASLSARVSGWRTLVWNGPLGAFETPPFDRATTEVARAVAAATGTGHLTSVAGGGDTLAALRHAGVSEKFTYVSAAGGAFLEWLEGRKLPGIAALER
ncbi:MAG TPA: phosphoglycerate kinase [Acetobacteraceae bacterium]|nr:phosphoglycerate kinase [Acetobacteraceae bacterium]